MGDKVDLKTVAVIIGIAAALAGTVGTYYVNSYRLDRLEDQDEKVMERIQDVKCLVAEVHDIPLPECK